MRRLALFAGGFSGAVLAFGLGLPWTAVLPAGLGAAALILLFLRRGWSTRAALLCLGLAAGLLWARFDWQRSVAPLQALDGKVDTVSVEAAGYSRATDYGTSTTVRLELDGHTWEAVLYGGEKTKLRPGDTLTGRVKFRTTGSFYGEDDVYYGAQGIGLTMSLYGDGEIFRTDRVPVRYWPAAFSNTLKERLRQLLPEQESGYAAALLTGDRSGLSDAFSSGLRQSGTAHVVAVSGMHIGILMSAVLLLLGNRRRLGAFLGLPIVWFFALAVGMTASVVRASIMLSIALLAPVFRRENDPPTTILAALMLILLENPRAILDVGLQLSFGSVAGILLFSKRCFEAMWESRGVQCLRKRSRILGGAAKTVLAPVASSISVLPITIPLSLLYFDSVSMASPLSSALILPLIPACFVLSAAAPLLSLLWMPLGAVLAWPLRILIGIAMTLTEWIARLPFASITGGGYFSIFLTGFYAILLAVLLARRPVGLLRPGLCVLGLFSVCLLLGSVEYDRAQLTVTMLDVGQGQCVYAESKGTTALYDCGGEDDPAVRAASYLRSIGRFSLDILVLSHYDKDHAGGVPELLETVPVDRIYLPEPSDEGGLQAEILEAAERSGTEVSFVTTDLTLAFGSAALSVYAPVRAEDGNNGSVSVHWRSGEFDVLLTGDMDQETEAVLLENHPLSGIEVIAAGHHGSASSTGQTFLDTVTPEIVLISVGRDNSYGHPAEETLLRLEGCGAAVYRTDQCGNITVRR